METGTLRGAVVGTVMSNLGLEHALRALNVEFKRAAVGDRYVLEMLRDHGWWLGGESSGHLICLDRTTTGDGIVAALQKVAEMLRILRTLLELKMGMSKFPQCMVNVRVTPGFDLRGAEVVQRAYQELVAELNDSGRVLLRASGTEPLIRVMVEGVDAEQVRFQAQRLARVVAEAASIASLHLDRAIADAADIPKLISAGGLGILGRLFHRRFDWV